MAEPFLGEIKMFGGNFAPVGYAQCNGQLLPISQNQALFSILGTTYGGDGRTTYALPDLRGRVPIHFGQGPGLSSYVEGELGGTESVTLQASQMPSHSHSVNSNSGDASAPSPQGTVPAGQGAYAAAANGTLMNSGMIAATGGSQPHTNIQPFLAVNFIIALQGIYPTRN